MRRDRPLSNLAPAPAQHLALNFANKKKQLGIELASTKTHDDSENDSD